MSMVTAVKYLAEFAAEALRPWDPSRELAARMLADLPLMVRLRADDEATADEVTFLVLGRFAAAEVPTVEGKDYLPGAIIPAGAAPLVALAMAAGMEGRELTASMLNAGTLVGEAVAALDEPTFCTDVYVGNEGEFKCNRDAGHASHHWNLLAEFEWADKEPVVLVSNACTCGHSETEHTAGVCMSEVTDAEFCPCGSYVRAAS